jgi:hypothetical protein
MTSSDRAPATATEMLTLDFLAWLDRSCRTYAETMEAWRTSCPRLSIWEDALADELIEIESGARKSISQAAIILTPKGRATLTAANRDRPSPRHVLP